MNENKYYLAIGATILVMALFYYSDKKNVVPDKTNSIDSDIETDVKVNTLIQSNDKSSSVNQAVQNGEKIEPQTNLTTSGAQQEEVWIRFSENLQTMIKCLELNKTGIQIDNKLEPTAQNLLNQLRSSLGEIVVEMDDWSQTEILEDGGKKRVRLDYEYPDGSTPVRRLSIYKINQYGMPEIVSLRNEEMNDPNEGYVQSLIEGRQILMEEKGRRGYFSDGEEVIYSQKNGRLANLSVTRGARNFSCYNLSDLSSNCACQ